ncbi:hypothetical protein V8J88_01300 [Massilia sp. W12]|uniref:hypothetical protein n=1 Tax=Massilia sp. W12 TaxID=3126507 RepID=UPI0030D57966
MGFPIKVLRRNGPNTVFNSLAELQAWLQEELQAWTWLAEMDLSQNALWEAALARQLQPLYLLQNMLPAQDETLDEAQERVLRAELNRAMFEQDRYAFKDVAAHHIVRAAQEEANPLKALGMLAQALHFPVQAAEAPQISAGREAWQKRMEELGELAQATEHLSELFLSDQEKSRRAWTDMQIMQAQQQEQQAFKRWQESQGSSHHLLQALHNEAARNQALLWKIGTMLLAWLALFVAAWLAAHSHYGPLSQGKEINWATWLERAPLYLLLFTAFFWGLRWFTRWFAESWAAQQSCHRRITSLELVIADRGAQLLLNYDEKDREYIRQQVFWQTALPESGAAKSEESLPLDALDKFLDILKKMREAGLDEKPKPGK